MSNQQMDMLIININDMKVGVGSCQRADYSAQFLSLNVIADVSKHVDSKLYILKLQHWQRKIDPFFPTGVFWNLGELSQHWNVTSPQLTQKLREYVHSGRDQKQSARGTFSIFQYCVISIGSLMELEVYWYFSLMQPLWCGVWNDNSFLEICSNLEMPPISLPSHIPMVIADQFLIRWKRWSSRLDKWKVGIHTLQNPLWLWKQIVYTLCRHVCTTISIPFNYHKNSK